MMPATVSTKPSVTNCTGETLSRSTASWPMPFDATCGTRRSRPHHPAAQLACEVDGFGHPDERVGREQPAGRVLPAHQRLEREDLAGAHVDFGQVVQDQGAVLDRALQMQLDVVAELALQRHVVGEHRDLVAAAALGASTAWSARRSRSEVVSRPGTPSATPMLTVRVSISPSMDTRSRSVACSRLASASASSRVHRLRPGRRRTRRRRGGRSGWRLRRSLRSRSAKTRMNQSPAVWPR